MPSLEHGSNARMNLVETAGGSRVGLKRRRCSDFDEAHAAVRRRRGTVKPLKACEDEGGSPHMLPGASAAMLATSEASMAGLCDGNQSPAMPSVLRRSARIAMRMRSRTAAEDPGLTHATPLNSTTRRRGTRRRGKFRLAVEPEAWHGQHQRRCLTMPAEEVVRSVADP